MEFYAYIGLPSLVRIGIPFLFVYAFVTLTLCKYFLPGTHIRASYLINAKRSLLNYQFRLSLFRFFYMSAEILEKFYRYMLNRKLKKCVLYIKDLLYFDSVLRLLELYRILFNN